MEKRRGPLFKRPVWFFIIFNVDEAARTDFFIPFILKI